MVCQTPLPYFFERVDSNRPETYPSNLHYGIAHQFRYLIHRTKVIILDAWKPMEYRSNHMIVIASQDASSDSWLIFDLIALSVWDMGLQVTQLPEPTSFKFLESGFVTSVIEFQKVNRRAASPMLRMYSTQVGTEWPTSVITSLSTDVTIKELAPFCSWCHISGRYLTVLNESQRTYAILELPWVCVCFPLAPPITLMCQSTQNYY